jgi:hypothetical protein
MLGSDGQGSDFGEILPAELQCAAAEDHTVIRRLPNIKIADMIVKLAQGAGQQFALAAVFLQQTVDSLDVLYAGFADHGRLYSM